MLRQPACICKKFTFEESPREECRVSSKSSPVSSEKRDLSRRFRLEPLFYLQTEGGKRWV